ncbi:MAG: SpoIIIAH-like family protein, partial [Clostridia bacterium]|nr:SpoIIIAH-like family protein [Clostridia bacterium]
MTFGKRQLVIAAMVTALGTAVYLNWQFSGVEPVSVNDTPSSISTSKQLGQTTYVNTEVSNAESSKKPESCSKTASSKTEKETQSSKVKQTVSENKSNLTKEQQEYFSSERAKRAQSQDKAQEGLYDIINSDSSSETAKKDAL